MNRMAMASGELAAMLRAVLGVPNYDRYLAHMRRCHPADTPLPRAVFEQQRLIDRYSKPGSKCC
jgi:uncharacterized short protein YbdD (DUF466 family)